MAPSLDHPPALLQLKQVFPNRYHYCSHSDSALQNHTNFGPLDTTLSSLTTASITSGASERGRKFNTEREDNMIMAEVFDREFVCKSSSSTSLSFSRHSASPASCSTPPLPASSEIQVLPLGTCCKNSDNMENSWILLTLGFHSFNLTHFNHSEPPAS